MAETVALFTLKPLQEPFDTLPFVRFSAFPADPIEQEPNVNSICFTR